jgi:hypothetical protein
MQSELFSKLNLEALKHLLFPPQDRLLILSYPTEDKSEIVAASIIVGFVFFLIVDFYYERVENFEKCLSKLPTLKTGVYWFKIGFLFYITAQIIICMLTIIKFCNWGSLEVVLVVLLFIVVFLNKIFMAAEDDQDAKMYHTGAPKFFSLNNFFKVLIYFLYISAIFFIASGQNSSYTALFYFGVLPFFLFVFKTIILIIPSIGKAGLETYYGYTIAPENTNYFQVGS